MTDSAKTVDWRSQRPWLPWLGVSCLAIAASISGISNQFAQDDYPLIFKNPALQDLWHSWRFFAQAYWPKPFDPDLYRPLVPITSSLEWALGHGSPVVFRVVSYLLYAAASLAMFRVARIALPSAVALAAAALFAVHPVHVEAVAAAVNQAELWVALLACASVALYVRARRTTGSITTGTEVKLAALYLVGCMFKENALMLPGLLIAAEGFLVPGGEPLRARLAQVRRLFLILLLVAVSFYWLRTRVLGGNLVGSFTAEALFGLSRWERTLTMLSVVPHWFRLLLWPAHLQVDYSPGEIVAQKTWGLSQTLGAMLLAGGVVAVIAARRRAPAISFGLVWAAVAIFPVHNVLVPTGIVLAERSLFLPSVGAMIALGGLGALLYQRARARERLALAGLLSALLILGTYRSASRQLDWSDHFGLWYRTANRDAPRSYRAHVTLATMYWMAGYYGHGEQEYHLAIQFAPPRVVSPMLEYADHLRLRGYCYPAVPYYRKVLAALPEAILARTSLIACLVNMGLYREAIGLARVGAGYGRQIPAFHRFLATADSALKAGAPRGAVKLVAQPGDSAASYLTIGTGQ